MRWRRGRRERLAFVLVVAGEVLLMQLLVLAKMVVVVSYVIVVAIERLGAG